MPGVLWRGGLDDPAIDPDPQVTGFRAGLAETGAADSLGIPKPGLAMIRQGEMGEVQMSDRPAGRIRSGARLLDAPAEERQLISEPATVLRREMAGVVPPFGPELIVSTVVVREAIRVARHSRTKAGVLPRAGTSRFGEARPRHRAETDHAEEQSESNGMSPTP